MAKAKKKSTKKAVKKVAKKKVTKKKSKTMAGTIKEMIIANPDITSMDAKPKIEKMFGDTLAFQNHYSRYFYNQRVALAEAGKIPPLKKNGKATSEKKSKKKKPIAKKKKIKKIKKIKKKK